MSASNEKDLKSADALLQTGDFVEAERLYAEALAVDPRNFQALVRLGYIALLANHLADAEKWLTAAMELKPEDAASKALLAESYYRRDDFQNAAPLLRAIGREAMARKLESFKAAPPYQIESNAEATYLKFVMTDPLPVVQVQVNRSESVNFFIDTGGAEVFIDTEFAEKVGAAQFGSETGTFAGGQQAGFQHGRIDSLTLGDFIIKNVPVQMMAVRRFSDVFGGNRVDGVLGTVLLYHFLATLDYPQGELILRGKTKESLPHFEQQAKRQEYIMLPFWMAGDHFMVAWGTANKSRPMLFFVDTGLAGGGFTCPESTLKEAGIKLHESRAEEGFGGGKEKVKAIPFVVEELTLGDAKEHNVNGLYAGPFPWENAFGFRIGGLISHEFFRPYALTLDFTGMRYFLKRKE